jgi:hypothetical protein
LVEKQKPTSRREDLGKTEIFVRLKNPRGVEMRHSRASLG